MDVQINISGNLNADTAQKLVGMLGGGASEVSDDTAPGASEKPETAAAQTATGRLSLDDLAAEARKALDGGARDELKGLLTSYNVVSLKDLSPETYKSFMDKLVDLNAKLGGGQDE